MIRTGNGWDGASVQALAGGQVAKIGMYSPVHLRAFLSANLPQQRGGGGSGETEGDQGGEDQREVESRREAAAIL